MNEKYVCFLDKEKKKVQIDSFDAIEKFPRIFLPYQDRELILPTIQF